MRNFVALAFILNSLALLGANEPEWHEGMIILKDGQIQRGKLAIQAFQIALFKTETGLEVYTPLKVKSIFYFDPHYNFYRKFVSFESRWGKPSVFYEVVVNGKLSIVRKLKSSLVSCDKRSDKSDYQYFVRQGSQLVSLKEFKSLYRKIELQHPALAEEIKLRKLNPAIEADAIRIVQMINDQIGVVAANF